MRHLLGWWWQLSSRQIRVGPPPAVFGNRVVGVFLVDLDAGALVSTMFDGVMVLDDKRCSQMVARQFPNGTRCPRETQRPRGGERGLAGLFRLPDIRREAGKRDGGSSIVGRGVARGKGGTRSGDGCKGSFSCAVTGIILASSGCQ